MPPKRNVLASEPHRSVVQDQAAVRPGGDRAQYARCPGRRPARIEKSKIDGLGRHEFAVIRHLGLGHALST